MGKNPRNPISAAYSTNSYGSGFGPIAHCHWGAAELLYRAMAMPAAAAGAISIPHSWHGAPAICEYWAAMECFINEYSAMQVMFHRFTEDTATVIQKAGGKEKINEFLEHLGIRAKFNGAVAREIKLSVEIRNLAYHHSPKIIPVNIYPNPIIQVTNILKCRQGEAVWTIYLEHIRVVEWCRQAVLNFINEFERLENPPVSVLNDPINGWLTMPLK